MCSRVSVFIFSDIHLWEETWSKINEGWRERIFCRAASILVGWFDFVNRQLNHMSFHGDPTTSLKAIHYEGNPCMQYCCKDEVFDKLWLTTWLTEWVTDGIPCWLITCSGVVFEELIFPRQLKFSSYPRTRRLTYDRLRKSPPLLPIPRQMNSLYTPPSYPFKISFNIFLPSTIRSSKLYLTWTQHIRNSWYHSCDIKLTHLTYRSSPANGIFEA
jgi:hypothetical protein